jgi:dTDP-glucose 4,6-dehydratase
MDGAKLTALGWRPSTAFEEGLPATIDWYRANEGWWRATRSGDWDGWYERQYGRRLANGQPAAAITTGSDPRPAGPRA